jgi:hypothetical protein
VWSATALAPSFSALEADVAAQLAPVWRIERSQLRADWHRYAVSWDHHLIIDARRSAPAGSWASVSESDDGTRRSFPSTDPGREVFQPNAVVGLCHGRASRLRGPCPAGRWSSPALPPCSSRPFLPKLHPNVLLFTTTRIAFMAYLSSLTGMRRLAFSFFRAALTARVDAGTQLRPATPRIVAALPPPWSPASRGGVD